MMAQDQITLAMLFHTHVGRKVVGIEPRIVTRGLLYRSLRKIRANENHVTTILKFIYLIVT